MQDLTDGEPGLSLQAENYASNHGRRRLLDRVGWVVVALLNSLILLSILGRMIFLFDPALFPDTGTGNEVDIFSARFLEHYLATVLHLIPALLISLIGPTQFIRRIRKRHRKLHRLGGITFIACGVMAAMSGLYFGVLYPFGGIEQGFAEAMSVFVLGLYTLICLSKAFGQARRKNFPAHREWMIRSWGLMLSVATQRVVVGLVVSVFDMDLVQAFGTALWLALAINIAACEYWINLTRTPGHGTSHWKDLDTNLSSPA